MLRSIRVASAMLVLVLFVSGCSIPDMTNKKSSLPDKVSIKTKDDVTTLSGLDYIVSANAEGTVIQAIKGSKQYLIKIIYSSGPKAETVLETPQEIKWYSLNKDGTSLFLLETASDRSSYRISEVKYPEGVPREIATHEGSPSGMIYKAPFFYYAAQGTIFCVDLNKSKEKRIIRGIDKEDGFINFNISPNGEKIAYVRDGELYIYEPKTEKETRCTKDADTAWGIKWAPDGSKVAFYSAPKNKTLSWISGYAPIAGRVGIYDLDNKELTFIKGTPKIAGFINWSPDSNQLAYGMGEAKLYGESLDFAKGLKMGVWDSVSGEKEVYGPFDITGEAGWTGNNKLFWPNNKDLNLLRLGDEKPAILNSSLSQTAVDYISPVGDGTLAVITEGKEGNGLHILKDGKLTSLVSGYGNFRFLGRHKDYYLYGHASGDNGENFIIKK